MEIVDYEVGETGTHYKRVQQSLQTDYKYSGHCPDENKIILIGEFSPVGNRKIKCVVRSAGKGTSPVYRCKSDCGWKTMPLETGR